MWQHSSSIWLSLGIDVYLLTENKILEVLLGQIECWLKTYDLDLNNLICTLIASKRYPRRLLSTPIENHSHPGVVAES